jgi:hypothetical protein
MQESNTFITAVNFVGILAVITVFCTEESTPAVIHLFSLGQAALEQRAMYASAPFFKNLSQRLVLISPQETNFVPQAPRGNVHPKG